MYWGDQNWSQLFSECKLEASFVEILTVTELIQTFVFSSFSFQEYPRSNRWGKTFMNIFIPSNCPAFD